MSHFSMAALAAVAVMFAAAPASAGDLGDGGYGQGSYGQKPYYSGQTDDEGRVYGRRDEQDYTGDEHAGVYNDDDDSDGDDGDEGDDDGDDQGGDNGDYREQRYEKHSYRHEGSVKDGYAPVPPAAVYSHRNRGGACVPGWRVKQRLTGEGWTNFHLKTYGRGVAIIRATRAHTGRPFVLKIDGCTGETLSSWPHGAHDRRFSSRY